MSKLFELGGVPIKTEIIQTVARDDMHISMYYSEGQLTHVGVSFKWRGPFIVRPDEIDKLVEVLRIIPREPVGETR